MTKLIRKAKQLDINSLIPIIFLTFVNVIGFTILIPILPGVVKFYSPGGNIVLIFSILISVYAIAQIIAAPFLGTLSDKYGRRPLLLISQLGTTLSWVIFGSAYFLPYDSMIFGFSLPLVIIMISRIVDGLTGGNVSVAQAWVSDRTSKENKTQAFGIVGAVFGLGFLLGPVIGGISSDTTFNYLGTVAFALILSIITLFFIYWKLPESLPKKHRIKTLNFKISEEINIFSKFSVYDDNPKMKAMLYIRLIFAILLTTYTTIVNYLLLDFYKFSYTTIGILLSSVGLLYIITQVGIVPIIARKIGDLQSFYLSIALICIGFIMAPSVLRELSPYTMFLLAVNTIIVNLGLAMGFVTFKALLTNSVDETKQGLITGIDESLLAFGRATAPLMSSIIFTAVGITLFPIASLLIAIPSVFVYLNYFNGDSIKKRSHFKNFILGWLKNR